MIEQFDTTHCHFQPRAHEIHTVLRVIGHFLSIVFQLDIFMGVCHRPLFGQLRPVFLAHAFQFHEITHFLGILFGSNFTPLLTVQRHL